MFRWINYWAMRRLNCWLYTAWKWWAVRVPRGVTIIYRKREKYINCISIQYLLFDARGAQSLQRQRWEIGGYWWTGLEYPLQLELLLFIYLVRILSKIWKIKYFRELTYSAILYNEPIFLIPFASDHICTRFFNADNSNWECILQFWYFLS